MKDRPYFKNYSEQPIFFIRNSRAHFAWDSPFIFWRNAPAGVMSSCVSTGDLWEHTCNFDIHDMWI